MSRLAAATSFLLAPCTAVAATEPQPIPIPATPAIAQEPAPTSNVDPQVRATVVPGTEPQPVVPRPVIVQQRHGAISLSFPGADVRVVAKAVLGDLLRMNYTVAEGVSAPVTLVTERPVAKSALLGLFEAALSHAGLALAPVAGGYEIENAGGARSPIAPEATGFGTEIVTLRFINADEVRKVLDSALPGVVVSTDPSSNRITIAGSTGQRASARDLLQQFDVDWLRNMSFALYIPQRTDARLIVPELDKLINAPDSPTHGLVRLIAMEQIDGILAISTQPQYLGDVQRWVEILDREGESNERKIFVYHVQNGRARDLAQSINAAYGMGGRDNGGSADPFAQGADTAAGAPAPTQPSAPSPGPTAGSSPRSSGGTAALRVTADEENNAVIVFGTPKEYATVEDGLRKLDVAPQQILIEAAITEVGLTDNLRYGVQWNFLSGDHSVGYSEGTTATPVQQFPGFSYFYGGSSITATLNALEQRTNIKVVSAPKLLVLNNHTAALQVGDQIPISTGTATNLNSGANAVVSTIEYRDTGVILKITPRVNNSGLVQLDVSQEVSDLSTNSPTAQTQEQSPTISTRRIVTTVAVRDGQVIALGGLFRDSKTIGRNGIPILSRAPIVGGLFGTHKTTDSRTELIVLLKPHVLKSDEDGRAVTEELRRKLRTLEPFRSTGRIP
jgi:general secretion pathway protein D